MYISYLNILVHLALDIGRELEKTDMDARQRDMLVACSYELGDAIASLLKAKCIAQQTNING